MGLVCVCVGGGCRKELWMWSGAYDCDGMWGALSVGSKCGGRWFCLWCHLECWFVGWSIVGMVDSEFVLAFARLVCLWAFGGNSWRLHMLCWSVWWSIMGSYCIC